jgi:hypothetical protein
MNKQEFLAEANKKVAKLMLVHAYADIDERNSIVEFHDDLGISKILTDGQARAFIRNAYSIEQRFGLLPFEASLFLMDQY